MHKFKTRLKLLCFIAIIAMEMLAASSLVRASPSSSPERGIYIQSSVILNGLPTPSYQELRTLGITQLITNVYSYFTDEQWGALEAWSAVSQENGFQTFASISSLSYPNWMVTRAVKAGFSGLELDEMLSTGVSGRYTLISIIARARALNPGVRFIITEYNQTALAQLPLWVEGWRGIELASSDYNHLNSTDQTARNSLGNGAAWIIFVPDPKHNWDCYANLTAWTNHVKTLNINMLLWGIDAAGTWKQNWSALSDLLCAS